MFCKQLYTEFVQADLNKFIISDSSSCEWAVNVAGEIRSNDFQLSGTIIRFEQAHHI
jgi:hypothetical protein